jgi:hypothetical protein
MMTRPSRFRQQAMMLGLAMAMVLFADFPAFGGPKRWRDDQIPFGPEGTIGRGTDSAYYPPYNIRGGIPLFTFSRSVEPREPEPSRPPATRVPAKLWITNRHYEPGDGYCYPLYYNPETRMYFYGPVRR